MGERLGRQPLPSRDNQTSKADEGDNTARPNTERGLSKAPTGISGLDEILRGGLPAGRATLITGGPGCGKTVLAMEFLTQGCQRFSEPGLFLSFEETPEDLIQNFESLGYRLQELLDGKQLRIAHVNLAHEVVEAGEFTLDGLFLLLDSAIATVGAKRVVLDSLDGLFSHFSAAALRGELARLFEWLKSRRVTTVVTAERGASQLTRSGIEAYISDCVLLLDHRVSTHIAKRRLRVIKYRGSNHGPDEYPFLITQGGVAVFPITSVTLTHVVSTERVSSGVPDLDAMLDRGGYYRGSNILVSGSAGTGKSTLAAAFASATCRGGGRCLYLAFEESEGQILRNMNQIGLELNPWIQSGHLVIQALRPTSFGLEEHLFAVSGAVDGLDPSAVVLDPITDFVGIGGAAEIKSMLVRLFDQFRSRGITALATNVTSSPDPLQETDVGVSSLVDTWIVLRHRIEQNRRQRSLYIAKSRGMAGSDEVCELVLSSKGVTLRTLVPDGAA